MSDAAAAAPAAPLAVGAPAPPPEAGLAPHVALAHRRTVERLRAVLLLSWLLPLLGFVGAAAYFHASEFDAARLRLDRAARIAQEHALKLFETNQMLLERMFDLLGDASDAELLARGPELHASLQRLSAGLPQVQGLFVIGADGRALAMSRVYPVPRQIDYTDREWYRVHREGRRGDAQPFFSEQLTSRATGERFFDMSRRRSVDGVFAGTVSVSLRPEYLTDFYAQLAESEPGLRMGLLRDDGRFVASWPGRLEPGVRLAADDPLLQRIASGARSAESDGVSSLDGVDRLRVLRRLEPYPLVVVAAVDRETVLAAWRRRMLLLALFALPPTAGFVWMARRALRRSRDEFGTLSRLDDERARRQRAEWALLHSQKLEAMGRLTGGVAHDFNNVLAVVSSNLYLHRRLNPAVAGRGELAAIERAVASGTRLTRQLLAFTRRQALRPERVELAQRLPAWLELLRPVLGGSIVLESRVAPDVPPIEVDPAELELALINLAINARDAMPEGGRLDIDVRRARGDECAGLEPGAYVAVVVSDDGSGIDPAIAERVFEPFFTTKPVGRGTGLGLAQVLALAQGAGGTARIASREGGRGTAVTLLLRAAPEVDAASAATPATDASRATAEAPPPAAAKAIQARVLLVEDNEAVAQATRQVLESLGCRIEEAHDGESAMARLEAHAGAFDLVLSDIEMPGAMDGIALAGWLAVHAPRLPVVLMSGYATRLEQARRARFEVLPKPCAPDVLAQAIAGALERARSATALA